MHHLLYIVVTLLISIVLFAPTCKAVTRGHRICFKQTENSPNSQCSSLNEDLCSGWSGNKDPTWTPYFKDNTNLFDGGCEYQWILQSNRPYNKRRYRVCFESDGNWLECQNHVIYCSGWSDDAFPEWTRTFNDDTFLPSRASTGCQYRWRIEEEETEENLDQRCRVCFFETTGNSGCEGTLNSCSGWTNEEEDDTWTKPFRDNTHLFNFGCNYHWRLQCLQEIQTPAPTSEPPTRVPTMKPTESPTEIIPTPLFFTRSPTTTPTTDSPTTVPPVTDEPTTEPPTTVVPSQAPSETIIIATPVVINGSLLLAPNSVVEIITTQADIDVPIVVIDCAHFNGNLTVHLHNSSESKTLITYSCWDNSTFSNVDFASAPVGTDCTEITPRLQYTDKAMIVRVFSGSNPCDKRVVLWQIYVMIGVVGLTILIVVIALLVWKVNNVRDESKRSSVRKSIRLSTLMSQGSSVPGSIPPPTSPASVSPAGVSPAHIMLDVTSGSMNFPSAGGAAEIDESL